MTSHFLKPSLLVAALAGTALGGPSSDDPSISNDSVSVVTDAIQGSDSEAERTSLANALVAMSTNMESFEKAQALYVAAFTAYRDGRYEEAAALFSDLGDAAPGTLLEADAERMLAKTHTAMNMPLIALDHYERSLAIIDAAEDAEDVSRQVSLSTVLPMYAVMADALGRHEKAVELVHRALTEVPEQFLSPGFRGAIMLTGARASEGAGDDAGAVGFYDQYLATYPDAGIESGDRIFVMLDRERAAGMPWGACTDEEMVFSANVLADERFVGAPGRYSFATFLLHCMDDRDTVNDLNAETLVEHLRDELADAKQAAQDAGASPLRMDAFNDAEGALLSAHASLLIGWNRADEARPLLEQLAARPDPTNIDRIRAIRTLDRLDQLGLGNGNGD